MKIVWNVFVGLLLINLLAVGLGVGWMYMDGRINDERRKQVIDMFSLTIDEEAEQEAEAARLAEEAQQKLEQLARLKSAGDGSITLREELNRNRQADESAMIKIELFNAQNKALREEMERFKSDHTRRVAQLDAEREAFEQAVQQRAEETKDANFQQVVGLYQTQPPKLTKEAFQALIQQGQTDQVVEYLAAMSKRKAGKVLSQFKTPEEIPQVAGLLEKLRTRGKYKINEPALPGGN